MDVTLCLVPMVILRAKHCVRATLETPSTRVTAADTSSASTAFSSGQPSSENPPVSGDKKLSDCPHLEQDIIEQFTGGGRSQTLYDEQLTEKMDLMKALSND